jgi:photosystem II stability/assembly factor-like uncharacterized protein
VTLGERCRRHVRPHHRRGKHWQAGVVEGAELLQFRDVHGVSAQEAYLLSAGVGEDSRIYKTVDGGTT